MTWKREMGQWEGRPSQAVCKGDADFEHIVAACRENEDIEGGMAVGGGSRGRGHMHSQNWSTLWYRRHQHNTVKQLDSNKINT